MVRRFTRRCHERQDRADFNRAYEPAPALTPYVTCPLAPPENRPICVTAGENRYRGAGAI